MKKQVKMNLIEQNVYVLACSAPFDEKKDYLQKDYVSQDEITCDTGIKVETTVQEYPVTPESVNSYADGTNYRNDLNAAVSRSAPGKNIGDVAALQNLLSQSPEQVKAFFDSVSQMIADSKKEPVVEKKEEVKDNG